MVKNTSAPAQKIALIIPAYNEAGAIGEVLAKLPTTMKIRQKTHAVVPVVVNDGSKDATGDEIAKQPHAIVVNHPINLGQGAALQTGIDWALSHPEFTWFVTYDADGQHDIGDVEHMLHKLENENLDVVLGSRFLGTAQQMGLAKKMTLRAAIKFTNMFSGVSLTDTHNGLRVFNRNFASQLNITMPGMAHGSEIIDKIGRGDWKYAEMPVTIHYTDYSRQKADGQSILNSVNILVELVLNRQHKK